MPTLPDQAAARAAHAVLTAVTCTWEQEPAEQTTAVVLHAAREMLILEAEQAQHALPPVGTGVRIAGSDGEVTGRLAEHGRGGRFLVCTADRAVRRTARLRVSLPATLRAAAVGQPVAVELADLTTGGARVRGVELPVHTEISLDFTPPGREQPVTVRASVAHTTQNAKQPWIGVSFRLVALRGGR